MKRIIALLLSVTLLSGILLGCTEEHFRFKDDTSLTRGQWVDVLAKTFGMEDYEKDTPYFSDVSSEDSIYTSVQSCYEWGVLRDASQKLKKHNGATLEFVVTTAVYATGADLSSYEGKNDLEKAINYAEINNIISQGLNYGKWATGQQCMDILAAAQDDWLNREITPIDKVVFHPSVSDERKNNTIKNIGIEEYLFSGKKPSVADIFIAPGTKENPDGVAIKIKDIVDNGDGTYSVKTTTPEIHEVFDELEYAGVVVPKIEDIIPADGVTISGLNSGDVSPVSYKQNDNGITKSSYTSDNIPLSNVTTNASNGVTTLAYGNQYNVTTNASNGATTLEHKNKYVPLGIGDSEKNALSLNAEINFTKGKVSVSPQWAGQSLEFEESLSGSSFSDEAGEAFKKISVFPDKTSVGPDAYKKNKAIADYKKGSISEDEFKKALLEMQDGNGVKTIPDIISKFEGGYEITGSLSITDLYIVPTYKLGLPRGIVSFSIETNYGASVSLSVKGEVEAEFTIFSVFVPFGSVGVLQLDVALCFGVNGEITVKASMSNNTKTEYSSGKAKKTSKHDESASAESELVFEAGPKLKAKLSALATPIVDASLSCFVQAKASAVIKHSAEWKETEDAFVIDRKSSLTHGVELHSPIIKLEIGSDKKTLANKLNMKFSWKISDVEGSNAPFTAKKISIIPEKEIVIWQEHLEVPKENNEKLEDSSEDSNNNSENDLGGNMNISSYYIHLDEGEEAALDLEYPNGYGAEDFKWKSSDTSIVTVGNGRIKSKKAGSAIISAESNDGKYHVKCAIYVGSYVGNSAR